MAEADWRNNIERLKSENPTSWNQLERALRGLAIVPLARADNFLYDRLRSSGVSTFGPESSGYSTDSAVRTSVEGAVVLAHHAASFARSSFGQLRPQSMQSPVPHVSIRANWSAEMNGFHLFLAVRVGNDEFLAEHEEFPGGVLRAKSARSEPPKKSMWERLFGR